MLLNRLGDYDPAIVEAQEAIRRNPAHAFPRSNLAYALRGAGRFAEARRVADEALGRNLGTGPLRRLSYQLAELDDDEVGTRAQMDWATQSAVGFDITGARAQVAAFHGRMGEARRLYAETIAGARAQGYTQVASGYAARGRADRGALRLRGPGDRRRREASSRRRRRTNRNCAPRPHWRWPVRSTRRRR